MAAMCVCGKYVYSTLNSPWSIYTMDLQGNVIKGTCVHGVHFPLQQNEANSKNIDIKES